MRRAISPLILGAALAAGCTYAVNVGKPFDAAAVKTIVVGKTTQMEIQKAFGNPFMTGTKNGDPTWTYVDFRYPITGGGNTVVSDLYVRFSSSGTVVSYSFQGQ
jgi:outer membrane protein assembly factor BamE (lipoprotein component of BamABCDE complex)